MTLLRKHSLLLIILLFSLFNTSQAAKVNVNNIPLDFDLLTFSVLPGDSLEIENTNKYPIFLVNDSGNKIEITKTYYWVAPLKFGIYPYHISAQNTEYKINFIVMKTMKQIKDTPNDFTIGKYAANGYKGLPQYDAPKGMIEVTPDNKDTYISPHFQLKDFLVKQASGHPKYVLISTKLLYKLELIIERLELKGYHVDHLHIMSGYRTPYYNATLGNGKSSRHLYGDAADIFLDNNHDNAMDDLNHDGKINIDDARILGKIVKEIDRDPQYKWLIGGLGIYKAKGGHRGFIHVDTRGFKARW